MKDDNYWKAFESSGSVEEYLAYKQQNSSAQKDTEDDEYDNDDRPYSERS